jgi:hypothetical protein
MFFSQLEKHREQLRQKVSGGGRSPNTETEIAETKKFIGATRDPRWKKQLETRLKQLEGKKGTASPEADKKTLTLLDELYGHIKDLPQYNRVRRKRKTA